MKKNIITTVILVIPFFCFSQATVKDTIYLFNNNMKVVAPTFMDFRKKRVLFINSETGKKDIIKFEDVESIKPGLGGKYVPRFVKGESELLFQMVEGNNSLYYQPGSHRYFFQPSDTLILLSRKYYKAALKLVYGEGILKEYALKSNLLSHYSSSYLTGLIHYTNGSKSKTYKKRGFRTNIDIGLLAFSGLGVQNLVGGQSLGRVLNGGGGISLSARLNNAFRLGFDAYQLSELRNIEAVKLYVPWPTVITPDPYFSKGFYDPPAMNKMKMSLVVLDPSISYYLFNRLPHRFSPYLFAGPSFIKPSGEIAFQLNYFNESTDKEHQYYRETRRTKETRFNGGIQGGVGGTLKVTDQLNLNLFVKHLRARFDNLGFTTVKSIENTIPLENDKIIFRYPAYMPIRSANTFVNFSLNYVIDVSGKSGKP